ncbi:MAG: SprT family zinc-dependent metalloprotease, partial [Prochlorococcaceae cyanobacterium]
MPLEPLLPLFHRLDREHFGGSLAPGGRSLVELRWSDGRMNRTAGLYKRGRHADGRDLCEIVLSRPLLEPLPREATLSTLCHEMIHAWVDRVLQVQEVHGPCFRARMAAINAAQEAFQVSLRHRYPVPVSAARWRARCPS